MVEDRRRPTPGDVWRRQVLSRIPIGAEQRKRAILEQFGEIGGNAPLADSDVICLGERHGPHDEAKIGEFIRAYARRRDVVLVEGVELHRRLVNESPIQEAYQFPKGVKVFGWDNLHLLGVVNARRRELEAMIERTRVMPQTDDRITLQNFSDETNDISVRQRNLSMKTAIDDVRLIHPNSRVFVIAGAGHFTRDPQLTDYLEQDKYIVLKPKR